MKVHKGRNTINNQQEYDDTLDTSSVTAGTDKQPLTARQRFVFLALILIGACVTVLTVVTAILYRHELQIMREMLHVTAQSQARFIEAVARYDAKSEAAIPGSNSYKRRNSSNATLSQIIEAHESFIGFGETGEITIARREGDSIIFVVKNRHGTLETPEPTDFESALAEPMRRALLGQSGTIVGLDYRGKLVMAAHEPVAELNFGIVAKIDFTEIRAPFVRSVLAALSVTLFLVVAGTALFFWVGNPIITSIENYARNLEIEIGNHKLATDELIRQQRTITLSNQIANVFLTSPKANLYADLFNAVLNAFDSKSGFFGFMDEAGNLTLSSGSCFNCSFCDPEHTNEIPFANWTGVWGECLIKQKTVTGKHFNQPRADSTTEVAALAVPIIHRNVLIGAFFVFGKLEGYDTYDQKLLESAATQTAPVLNAILQDDIQKREHTKLQEQYHLAQKAESVGRLAGGIAHDLNNLLSPILGYGEMISDDISVDDPNRECVEEIMSAGLKARDLVRQLLAFSSKQTLEYKLLDMNEVVGGFGKLLERTIPEDITINIMPSLLSPPVMADAGQIEQVIMNLTVNAAHSMPEGGKLTIEVGHEHVDAEFSETNQGFYEGDFVTLSISDTGSGMEQETLEHLFEPFYTTKGSEGTGLGLATVYGIVKQHSGNILVSSELEKGSTFKVYLPASKEEYQKSKTPDSFVSITKGSETVLLVEDNSQVRHLCLSILKRQGYNVLVSENGIEALDILRTFKEPIHLLLTDVVMPQMNGKELFSYVIDEYPDIKVLFMSGYTNNIIANRGFLEEGTELIQKPFSVKALAARVRRVLDA